MRDSIIKKIPEVSQNFCHLLNYHCSPQSFKYSQMQKSLKKLKNHSRVVDMNFLIDRDRVTLINNTFHQINNFVSSNMISINNLICILHPFLFSKFSPSLNLNTFFKNERGEGLGVIKEFFVALTDALLKNEDIPFLDYFSQIERCKNLYSTMNSNLQSNEFNDNDEIINDDNLGKLYPSSFDNEWAKDYLFRRTQLVYNTRL
ncbi:MAG: E3 ubiquitin-protein ligase ubr5, partial [Paramarteilia canceri]